MDDVSKIRSVIHLMNSLHEFLDHYTFLVFSPHVAHNIFVVVDRSSIFLFINSFAVALISTDVIYQFEKVKTLSIISSVGTSANPLYLRTRGLSLGTIFTSFSMVEVQQRPENFRASIIPSLGKYVCILGCYN